MAENMYAPEDGENSEEVSNGIHDLEIRNGANQDDFLPPLLRLERYAMSDNIYDRQMVGRVALETLRSVADTPEDIRAAMDIINRAAFDTEITVRAELMEQLPHIAMVCHEERDRLYFVVQEYLLPLVIRLLGDSDNQVRKTTQAALLVLMEQGLVEIRDVEQRVCPVILTLTEVDNLVEFHTGAVTLMSKMAPLLGGEATERLFMHRFAVLCADPVFYVRKVCANSFGDFCAVVGTAATEEFLLPYFVELCSDGIWGVRKACAEVFTTVALHCTLRTRKETLAPVFNNLLLDQSRWVRMSAFQALGQFIATFVNTNSRNVLHTEHGGIVTHHEDLRFSALPSGPIINATVVTSGEEAASLLSSQPFHFSKGNLPVHEGNHNRGPNMSCYICCMQTARISNTGNMNTVPLLSTTCCGTNEEIEKTEISNNIHVNSVHTCNVRPVNDQGDSNMSCLSGVENGNTSQSFNAFQYWRVPIPELELSNTIDEDNTLIILSRKKTNDVCMSSCPLLQTNIKTSINQELDYLTSRLEQGFLMDGGEVDLSDLCHSKVLRHRGNLGLENIQNTTIHFSETQRHHQKDIGSVSFGSQDQEDSATLHDKPHKSYEEPTSFHDDSSISQEMSGVSHGQPYILCEETSISPNTSYEDPHTFYDYPHTSPEEPSATLEDSSATLEDSSATLEDSSATLEDSSATLEDSSATLEDSSATFGDSSANLGDSSANLGDSSANLGDSSANLGDSSAYLGDSSAYLGDSSAYLGDSSATLGDSSATLGDSSATLGDSSATLGDSSATLGDSSATLGDSSATLGDSSAGLGDSSAGLGDSSAGLGDSSAGLGDSSAGLGDSSAGLGDSSAGLGASSAGLGDSSAGLGDSSAGLGDSSAGLGDSSAGLGDSSAGLGDSSAGLGDSSAGLEESSSSREKTCLLHQGGTLNEEPNAKQEHSSTLCEGQCVLHERSNSVCKKPNCVHKEPNILSSEQSTFYNDPCILHNEPCTPKKPGSSCEIAGLQESARQIQSNTYCKNTIIAQEDVSVPQDISSLSNIKKNAPTSETTTLRKKHHESFWFGPKDTQSEHFHEETPCAAHHEQGSALNGKQSSSIFYQKQKPSLSFNDHRRVSMFYQEQRSSTYQMQRSAPYQEQRTTLYQQRPTYQEQRPLMLFQEQRHCSIYPPNLSSLYLQEEEEDEEEDNTSYPVVNNLIQSNVPSNRPLQDIVPHYLVEHFVSMTHPSQAQNTDNEITHHCAFSIPAVALTLGRNNWHLIKSAYEALASDVQWKVRRTVAASIHELAVILGEELAGSDLVPVFHGFIKDLDEVRIGALKHLADFLKLLRPAERSTLLHRLSDFNLTDNECNWRFRNELAGQLLHSIALFTPGDTHEHITPLAISLLMDKVAAVRKKALCLVTQLVHHVSSEINLVRNLLAELAEQFAHNKHWSRRQTFALLCSKLMFQHVLKDEHFASDVFPHLLDLSWDPVPNVRLSVAQTVACDVAVQSYFISSESPHNEVLIACLRRLQDDDDKDVRYFASLYSIPSSTSSLKLSSGGDQ